jgi:hypothetical protein
VRSDSEPLGPFVQIDEALVGGMGAPSDGDQRFRLKTSSCTD